MFTRESQIVYMACSFKTEKLLNISLQVVTYTVKVVKAEHTHTHTASTAPP